MDWITLTVEAIGIVILCVWVVVPIREFAVIARRILPNTRPQLSRTEAANPQTTSPKTTSLVETRP
jgi:hypothetical protein